MFCEYFGMVYNCGLLVVACVCVFQLASGVISRIQYYKGAYYQCTGKKYGCNTRREGSLCEADTYEALRHMEKKGYRFLFGAYLPKHNGTTEVDAIVFGPKGIVVVECKDYSGEIIGREDDMYWSQEKPHAYQRNEGKRWFYNPIMQNAGHIRALKKMIGYNVPVYSMIVFSDHCTLKVPSLWQQDVRVTQVGHAARAFEALTANGNAYVDECIIDSAYNRVKPFTRVDIKTKRRHIKQCNAAAAAFY